MSTVLKKNGRCLCGAVTVKAKQVSPGVGACHCGMCRRWGGGAFMTVDGGTDVMFEGKEHIKVYNSSEWAERGFCQNCGTHLFYRLKQNGLHILSLGMLDDEKDFVFDHQIFIDHQSSLYRFANKTNNMTEAEVFAKFAPPA